MSSVPLSRLVGGKSGVIAPAGGTVAFNGVLLTKNSLVLPGTVQQFASLQAVGAFFGTNSTEYTLASYYFGANTTATLIPGNLIFAPYETAAVGGLVVGGSLTGVSIATINALANATMTISVDGTPQTSASINLSSVVSLAAVATAITTAFAGTTVPLTCTVVAGTNQLELAATTGTTHVLAYPTSTTQTSTLKLTNATGAVVTAPQSADTPSSAMNNVYANVQNWVTFSTVWEPSQSDKLAFAAWGATVAPTRFAYIAWDTDSNAIVANNQTNFAYLKNQANIDGTLAITGSAAGAADAGSTLAVLLPQTAAMVMGVAATIDWNAANGRRDFAYLIAQGLLPSVDSDQDYVNLIANGYSCYGKFANAQSQFINFQNGQIGGQWLWLDSYLNAIQLQSAIQSQLISFREQIKSIPYNQGQFTKIQTIVDSVMQQGLIFGSVVAGVSLSTSEQLLINNLMNNQRAAGVVSAVGFFTQVLDPGATVRASRGSPIINVAYADGESIQTLFVNTYDVL